nr:MAG TPA: hypothetical protein [Bacteriophage sp.]
MFTQYKIKSKPQNKGAFYYAQFLRKKHKNTYKKCSYDKPI